MPALKSAFDGTSAMCALIIGIALLYSAKNLGFAFTAVAHRLLVLCGIAFLTGSASRASLLFNLTGLVPTALSGMICFILILICYHLLSLIRQSRSGP
jgi:hypothetical protein